MTTKRLQRRLANDSDAANDTLTAASVSTPRMARLTFTVIVTMTPRSPCSYYRIATGALELPTETGTAPVKSCHHC